MMKYINLPKDVWTNNEKGEIIKQRDMVLISKRKKCLQKNK